MVNLTLVYYPPYSEQEAFITSKFWSSLLRIGNNLKWHIKVTKALKADCQRGSSSQEAFFIFFSFFFFCMYVALQCGRQVMKLMADVKPVLKKPSSPTCINNNNLFTQQDQCRTFTETFSYPSINIKLGKYAVVKYLLTEECKALPVPSIWLVEKQSKERREKSVTGEQLTTPCSNFSHPFSCC